MSLPALSKLTVQEMMEFFNLRDLPLAPEELARALNFSEGLGAEACGDERAQAYQVLARVARSYERMRVERNNLDSMARKKIGERSDVLYRLRTMKYQLDARMSQQKKQSAELQAGSLNATRDLRDAYTRSLSLVSSVVRYVGEVVGCVATAALASTSSYSVDLPLSFSVLLPCVTVGALCYGVNSLTRLAMEIPDTVRTVRAVLRARELLNEHKARIVVAQGDQQSLASFNSLVLEDIEKEIPVAEEALKHAQTVGLTEELPRSIRSLETELRDKNKVAVAHAVSLITKSRQEESRLKNQYRIVRFWQQLVS